MNFQIENITTLKYVLKIGAKNQKLLNSSYLILFFLGGSQLQKNIFTK